MKELSQVSPTLTPTLNLFRHINVEHSPINYSCDSSLNYECLFKENEYNKSNVSVPAPDGITHLLHTSFKNLLHFYYGIFPHHAFPAAFHDAIVIPCPKFGKDSANSAFQRTIIQ